MNLRLAAAVFGLGGVGLTVVGLLWPVAAQRGSNWTEQQAKQYAQSAADLHYQAHAYGHAQAQGHGDHGEALKPGNKVTGGKKPPKHADEKPVTQADLEATRARFRQSSAELESARTKGQTFGAVLKWLGVVCSIAGVAGYFALPRTG